MCLIGDSWIQAGIISQRLLDIAETDVTKIQLIGTRGTGVNRHEGRGGWTVADYASSGRIYYQFTVSGVSEMPAINSATYTSGGSTFMVQEVAISGGSGTILCNLISGSAPSGSGTLTKSNSAKGDATIAFSAASAASGNPFWFNNALNFSTYLSANSLSAPDIVLIHLGINDSFSAVYDYAVDFVTLTAFPRIAALIASIKAVNSSVKIGICAPPTYASQDAFGGNYGCGTTGWRAKRNIVQWNKKLYAYFGNKETDNIFIVPTGINLDVENNFPTSNIAANSQNPTLVNVQTNAIHPAESGYKQMGDSIFAFIKAVA